MGKIAYAGPFYGEFGWEIMTWQPYLRAKSRDVDKMWISTFPGMEALYTGFHCPVEFVPHNHPGRALEWRDVSLCEHVVPDDVTERIDPIKRYRPEGEFVRFGTPRSRDIEVVFHARGVQKSSFKNYPADRWQEIAEHFPKSASVGSKEDHHIPGTEDRRGIPLQELMDTICGAHVIVGGSSGVMHLASLCGTRQVVWAEDEKTHFGEKLEVRYMQTWNPLWTPVTWIASDNWNPPAERVLAGILAGAKEHRPGQMMLNALKAGFDAGRYLICNAFITSDDKIKTAWETQSFPKGDLMTAIDQIKLDMTEVEDISDQPQTQKAGETAWR